ncbi:MAG TPA: hypothetical protein VK577_12010, partial [Bradyrhizobium sp.]|nr:hypothetical protein [Bradyrhizobium sp.]
RDQRKTQPQRRKRPNSSHLQLSRLSVPSRALAERKGRRDGDCDENGDREFVRSARTPSSSFDHA